MTFNIQDYFLIQQKIDDCDAFFNALYSLVSIEYSNSISTAGVTFDKEGNTLRLLINKEFWESLDTIDHKAFVILHELLHIVYNHAKRAIQLGLNQNKANIAMDIVINHKLVNSFNIDRYSFTWENYCWVDTVFKDMVLPDDRNFEFYYSKLPEETNEDLELLGNHFTGEGTTSNPDELIEENNPNKQTTNAELQDILKQNPELTDLLQQSPEFGSLIKESNILDVPLSLEQSGKSASILDIPLISNYSKLIRALKKSTILDEYEMDTWVGEHRRYTNLDKNIILPNVMEYEKPKLKNVWLFMDSSGSCYSMFYAFAKLVKDLIKNPSLLCRAFTFGDSCDEIDINFKKVQYYGGNDGGFDCIEHKILSTIKVEQIKYPDNIVVISDGGASFGNIKKLYKPQNWIMLFTNRGLNRLVPAGGQFIHLDKSFFAE